MKKKILIIEDDPRLRHAIQYGIDTGDYVFLEAESVRDGISLLTDNPEIDVVILDLEFPADSGISFLEYIKDEEYHFRTIILTAHDELLAADKARNYDVFAYQTKTDKLAVHALEFAVEQAFQDIENEFLHKNMSAHLEIHEALNSDRDLDEILGIISGHLLEILGAYTCHTRVYDPKRGDLVLSCCKGPFENTHEIFEERVSFGEYYSGKIAVTREPMIIGDLQSDPPFLKGKKNVLQKGNTPEVAKRYFAEVQSAYIIPIFTGIRREMASAIVNISSDQKHFFSDPDKCRIVSEFGDQISLAVTKFRLNEKEVELHTGYRDISGMLSEISSELKGEYDLEKIFDIVNGRISSCINPEVLSIFLYDEKSHLIQNTAEYKRSQATEPVNEEYHSGENLTGWVYQTGKTLRLQNPKRDYRFQTDYKRDHPCVEQEHYLCAPMKIGSETIGVIRTINKLSEDTLEDGRQSILLSSGFSEEDEAFLEIAASHLAVAIRNAKTRGEADQWIRNLTRLNEIMQKMAEKQTVDALLTLILDQVQELIDFEYGLITRVDLVSGKQHFVASHGGTLKDRSLPLWGGIIGLALKELKPIKADDVRIPPWNDLYRERWKDIRSELAVPIFIASEEVRVGQYIYLRPKHVGVINLESRQVEGFSKADKDLLVLLARHAAIMIERLEYEQKLSNLHQVERDIAGKQDWEEIIRIVIEAITDTLGYDYVNISLIDWERNRIKTAYVTGVQENEVAQFKELADHSLDSNDIQADIVRSRSIEVPDKDDPRLDRKVVVPFQLGKLLRVFIPMIASADDRVIGTVEAGHRREHRSFIYEQDIQILRDFIGYAVDALEKRKKGLLDKISHEFRSPIIGIRSHASFLYRRIEELGEDIIERKFKDILNDSELLLIQVMELEYILGRQPPTSKIEKTLLFRDIIIKTIQQLRHLLFDKRFNPSKIEYNIADVRRLGWFYIDRSKLNQVVYNLLVNSIKYSEDDPKKFTIRISGEKAKNKHQYLIKFKDWGIGVAREYGEQIFDEGFRAPEAVQRNILGRGLGLTISRQIMRDMGGDLKLVGYSNPTEFQIILPAELKEIPDDSIH